MGRAGRFACIFTPMVATIAAAVLIILSVFIGQSSKSGGLVSSMYFVRLDTRNLDIKDSLANNDVVDNLLDRVGGDKLNEITGGGTAKELGLADWYQAGFFGYCSGEFNKDNSTTITKCSKPKAYFVFNIIDIINEEKKTTENLTFPNEVTKVSKAVNAVSRISFTLFIVGIIATFVEFAVGWFGLLSRWGSCCTTIVANVAFIALLGGGIFNTVLFSIMDTAFNKSYGSFGVVSTFNKKTYSTMWIGIALSFGAAFFWLLSTCCCSGRRDKIVRGDKRGGASRSVEKGYGGGNDYQRVPSPYTTPLMGEQSHGQVGGGAPHPGSQYPGSYEPMRHQHV